MLCHNTNNLFNTTAFGASSKTSPFASIASRWNNTNTSAATPSQTANPFAALGGNANCFAACATTRSSFGTNTTFTSSNTTNTGASGASPFGVPFTPTKQTNQFADSYHVQPLYDAEYNENMMYVEQDDIEMDMDEEMTDAFDPHMEDTMDALACCFARMSFD